MRAKLILAALLVVATAGSALGQTNGMENYGLWEGGGYGPGGGYPSGYGDYGDYGGTYEGSVLNGMGSFARGVGEYNYYTAMAVRELELARAQYLRNYKQGVTDWYAMRKTNEEVRAAKRDKLTPEKVARITEANRPDRLTAGQYEPATGRLVWPAALQGGQFAEQRAALEAAFAKRTAKDAGADSEFHANVDSLAESMLAKLRQKAGEMNAMQFIAAKKFLTGLKYESLLPIDAKALAASE